MLQQGIHSVKADDIPQLVKVWEASVRATHFFLAEADILGFKPLVRDGLFGVLELACMRDRDGTLIGFIGIFAEKIEALFVDPGWRGSGIGCRLVEYAITRYKVTAVDVNEQNEQAIGFYSRMGFEVVGRSEVDSLGEPFPLLHLRLPA